VFLIKNKYPLCGILQITVVQKFIPKIDKLLKSASKKVLDKVILNLSLHSIKTMIFWFRQLKSLRWLRLPLRSLQIKKQNQIFLL